MLEAPIHSRQFVLGSRPVTPKEVWLSLRLDEGLFLSHCPKLKVGGVVDRPNRQWLPLGIAVQVDLNRPAPEEDLRRRAAADVLALYETWAGRWLLIGDHTIHLDAGGLLGSFYRLAPDKAGRQQLWVSFSLPRLASLPGIDAPPGKPCHLQVWVCSDTNRVPPPPCTGYPGIRKVLPTQTLDTAAGRTQLWPFKRCATHVVTHERVLGERAGWRS